MPVPIVLRSPLEPNDLLFESMIATSGLGQLDEMQLGLLSAKPDLKADQLLGKPVTVTMNLRDDAKRHFHGYVTRFGIGARRGRYHGYHASVRPWLWFLTRTADCRIFHDATVPDIVKDVFADHPSASFEFKLFRQYRKWTYCVQYRESDYNFVARLLEHEGIYWYWKHGDGASTLILVDSQSAHDAAPGCEELPYHEDGGSAPDTECVSQWHFASEVSADEVVLTSYDFERPSTSLRVDIAKPPGYKTPRLEVFDFQGDYVQATDGKQCAEDRLDEHHTQQQAAHASSNAHGIEVGRLLKLARHPREDQNAGYLVTGTSIRTSIDAYETGGQPGDYRCDFTVVPAGQQFRPQRRTPKPFVQGPQTAVVIGPAGEEIHTDKYGRVKVQFHWDRRGKRDGKDACWVRVSHPWAGKNFGAMHVPRIGQEVIVGFLEGDPDQPLITGRVYNAEQMPPWDLPANATQSGILSRSSKGGSAANANAIRFEDKKGAEQLWIHAERNQDIEVENDETHWVGHDRKKTVDHDETVQVKHDRTETVDNNETITVHGMRTETVDKDEKITVHGGRTEVVDKEERITVHGGRTEQVDKNETIKIGGDRKITVSGSEAAKVTVQRTHLVGANETIGVGGAQEIGIGGAQLVVVGAAQSINVVGAQSTVVGAVQSTKVVGSQSNTIGAGQQTSVTGERSVKVSAGQTTSVGAGRKTSVADDDALKVGKNFIVEAGDSISLTTGSASLTMKKDGSITIKGKDILIQGSGSVDVKASGEIVIKGSKVGID